MDIANNKTNLKKIRLLLHRGMRDTKGKRTKKDGSPAQVSTYYPGIYGFSTEKVPNEIKIGVSRELYDRLMNHRLCFPKEMFVHFLVITKLDKDHNTEWQTARAIEKVIHSKVKKVPGSYSKEWGIIVQYDHLREVLSKILNDHKDSWRYIIVFKQNDKDGFWKIIENKGQDLKAGDWRYSTESRQSEVRKIYDLIHPHRGGARTEDELILKTLMTYKHLPEVRRIIGRGVVSDTIQKIKEWFFAPKQLNGTSQKVYDEVKDWSITKLMVNRVPVNPWVEKLINVISLGKYKQAKKDLAYDKMFHLSLVMYTDKGTVSIEKNERVNLQKGGTGSGESIDIPFSGVNIDTFLANAEKAMGKTDFYTYDAWRRNCQDFVLRLLESNNALTSEARDFIKQDALAILARMPPYVSKITRGLTDFGAKLNQLITGRGKH